MAAMPFVMAFMSFFVVVVMALCVLVVIEMPFSKGNCRGVCISENARVDCDSIPCKSRSCTSANTTADKGFYAMLFEKRSKGTMASSLCCTYIFFTCYLPIFDCINAECLCPAEMLEYFSCCTVKSGCYYHDILLC